MVVRYQSFLILSKYLVSILSFSTRDIDKQSPVGLYIHIPYCRRRCRYCNFAIVPIGLQGPPNNAMETGYKQAILTELKLIQKYTGAQPSHTNSMPQRIPLRSVYFGGGTPSLAPTSTIEEILRAVLSETSPFYVSDNDRLEITMEMDPGTFQLDQLRKLKSLGVNRVSLGVQSFSDDILSYLGRTHRLKDILQSIEYISYSGINNYSIDLISGLPLLDLATWAETLEIATSQLNPIPSHLSIYDLQVEKGTVFGKWYESEDHQRISQISQEKPHLPTTDDCAFMYRYASGYLRSKGYDHYEISSYARQESHNKKIAMGTSPWRSQHNQIYWETGAEWYALGLGATSCLQGTRYSRPTQMKDYVDWVGDEEYKSNIHPSTWTPPWAMTTDESENSLLLDVIMTRLRTKEGLDLRWVDSLKNGSPKVEAILNGAKLGLDLGYMRYEHDKLRLTDPDGFLFSNELISNIWTMFPS